VLWGFGSRLIHIEVLQEMDECRPPAGPDRKDCVNVVKGKIRMGLSARLCLQSELPAQSTRLSLRATQMSADA